MPPDPRRIEELFDAVVDLDPASAARRLDELCDGDEALRAAVEELVRHDRAADDRFLAPSPALFASLWRAARREEAMADEASPAADPARLGRFVVLRRLGEGGMGVVYLGYDELLDRRVALKLLRGGAAIRDRVVREAQALARLSHPNVVAVHEVGEHEGRVFLAMEFVEGPSLRAFVADEGRSIEELLGVFLQAGRGLAAAHDAGLVHRDFKPDNVLVGKDGRARVVDFGIAVLAEPDRAAAPAPAAAETPDDAPPKRAPSALENPLNRRGARIGTPAFMAPEQLRGERATPASDQFAFCVALYRAAYGAPPYPGDETAELVKNVLAGQPTPPPRRPGIPAWLSPLLLRGLSCDPAARFPSLEALLEAIQANLPRHPDLDPSAVRRERRLMAAGMLAVSAALAAFMAWTGIHRALADRWTPVRIAAGLVVLWAAVAFLMRRKLSQSSYARRLVALLLGSSVVMLAHRLVALRLGAPAAHVLVTDLLLLGAIFGTAAVTFEFWMGWLAALSFATAAAASLFPALTPAGLPFVVVTGMTIALVRWSRER